MSGRSGEIPAQLHICSPIYLLRSDEIKGRMKPLLLNSVHSVGGTMTITYEAYSDQQTGLKSTLRSVFAH